MLRQKQKQQQLFDRDPDSILQRKQRQMQQTLQKVPLLNQILQSIPENPSKRDLIKAEKKIDQIYQQHTGTSFNKIGSLYFYKVLNKIINTGNFHYKDIIQYLESLYIGDMELYLLSIMHLFSYVYKKFQKHQYDFFQYKDLQRIIEDFDEMSKDGNFAHKYPNTSNNLKIMKSYITKSLQKHSQILKNLGDIKHAELRQPVHAWVQSSTQSNIPLATAIQQQTASIPVAHQIPMAVSNYIPIYSENPEEDRIIRSLVASGAYYRPIDYIPPIIHRRHRS